MKCDNLRASTINTYKDCEFKYFLEYVVGFPSLAGFKAEQGTIVHHVAEILAKAKKTRHYLLNDKYTNPDYLLKICWNRSRKNNPRFADKYTNGNYNLCRKYIQDILDSKYNPLNLNILAIEKQFELDIERTGFICDNGSNLKLRGTIDLICEFDHETLHIIDWKTGERKDWITGLPKEYEDFYHDIQFRVYDLAISAMYPKYKYLFLTMVFVRDGGPFTIMFDLQDKEKTLDLLRKFFNEIKNNDKPKRLKDNPNRKQDLWKCRNVCHFGKTVDSNGNNLCDSYFNILKKEGYSSCENNLQQISISANATYSRRNDYERDSIVKGKIT